MRKGRQPFTGLSLASPRVRAGTGASRWWGLRPSPGCGRLAIDESGRRCVARVAGRPGNRQGTATPHHRATRWMSTIVIMPSPSWS